MKYLLASSSLLALMTCAGVSHAADAAADTTATTAGQATLEEVVVTGTRETGIKAEDSAAPIQVVGSRQLLRTGATDLAISLSNSVPSLNIFSTRAWACSKTEGSSIRSPASSLISKNRR